MSKPAVGTNYSVERVALMLHVSPQVIIQAIEQGRLGAVKENSSYLIPEESLDEFLKNGNPFVAWLQYTIVHRDSGVELISGTRFTNKREAIEASGRMNFEAGNNVAAVWVIEYTGSQPIAEEKYEVVDKADCKALESWYSLEGAIGSAIQKNAELKKLGAEGRFFVRSTNSTWKPIEMADP